MFRILIVFIALAGSLMVCTPSHAEPEYVDDRYPTRFGDLEFMLPSHDVKLNGSLLIKSDQKKDMYGRSMTIYREELYEAPTGKKDITINGKTYTRPFVDRVLLSEAGIGTCSQHFIIIDLRGSTPYVTNSFGNNPGGKYCFTVKNIAWGAKESSIFFINDVEYLYPTGEDVFGPVE